ncbi:MAG: hypothetical protein AAF805_00775 [Planctomycetota bacterium]
MNDTVILAGDLGLHYGLCLVVLLENGSIEYVNSTHVDIAREVKRSRGAQMIAMADRVVAWCEQRLHGGVDRGVYEALTPVSYDTSLAQGQCVGAYLQSLERLGASGVVDTCYPSTLKKWATGHGFAKKPEMVARANELSGCDLPIHDDNEADAVCLAFWAAERLRERLVYREGVAETRSE